MSYPGGRLHHLLREEGLVYMVHANVRPGIEPGVISIIALTSADKLGRVQSIIDEQIISLLILIITFFATVWFAAKIYRVGILMYGKKASYKEIWKWLRH